VSLHPKRPRTYQIQPLDHKITLRIRAIGSKLIEASGAEGALDRCAVQWTVAFQDTSTGEIVASIATKMGTCDVMRQNPWNGCLGLGHPNGVVTMWSPNITAPLVRMLCHKACLSPTPTVSSDCGKKHVHGGSMSRLNSGRFGIDV